MNDTARPTDHADTIVARATAAGQAAIAVVRLDGPDALSVASKVWDGTTDKTPKPREMHLGQIRNADGEEIDRALMVYFKAPHSYTGNDVVEFQTHGSPAVVEAVIAALIAAGAHMARPGEFTERAFFNNRMDLAQAEGVANLIASQTRAASRIALSQLEGRLSEKIHSVRESLLDCMAEIEARIDFPEEDIEPETLERLGEAMDGMTADIEMLLATARRGRLMRDGARVAIAGRPNAGKSSLFNALIGLERALVTPHAGTTRDTIEATIDLDGMPLVLVDTAGVRDDAEADAIENLGIERTRAEIRNAELVLFVLDASRPWSDDDVRLAATLSGKPVIAVLNKTDLPRSQGRTNVLRRLEDLTIDCDVCVEVSAMEPKTLEPLEAAVQRTLLDRSSIADVSETAVVTNQRHTEALEHSRGALQAARAALDDASSPDLIMVDLRESLDHLHAILGLRIDDEILDRIFSRFCLGK